MLLYESLTESTNGTMILSIEECSHLKVGSYSFSGSHKKIFDGPGKLFHSEMHAKIETLFVKKNGLSNYCKET